MFDGEYNPANRKQKDQLNLTINFLHGFITFMFKDLTFAERS